ncbi:MAG: hypothetical protein GY904_27425 [Planctomycetaceae bacterium]|nr:hypothetical protein [Planctomycetaceae bacterium]
MSAAGTLLSAQTPQQPTGYQQPTEYQQPTGYQQPTEYQQSGGYQQSGAPLSASSAISVANQLVPVPIQSVQPRQAPTTVGRTNPNLHWRRSSRIPAANPANQSPGQSPASPATAPAATAGRVTIRTASAPSLTAMLPVQTAIPISAANRGPANPQTAQSSSERVQQAAWVEPGDGTLIPPSNVILRPPKNLPHSEAEVRVSQVQAVSAPRRVNFFNDPFGQDPGRTLTQSPAAPAQAPATEPAPTLEPPASSAIEMVVPPMAEKPAAPQPPSNGLRDLPAAGQNTPAGGFQLPTQDPATTEDQRDDSTPQLELPTGPTTPPANPVEDQTEIDDSAESKSMRDLLRNESPDQPKPPTGRDRLPVPDATPESDSADPSSKSRLDLGTQDLDASPTPYQRDRTADEADRKRLRESQDGRYFDDGSRYQKQGSSPFKQATFSCDEFRERIAAQTIDLVSLDISPPFRPGEFDQDNYNRLKSSFLEKQTLRQWRDRDGDPLAVGRLTDLAYQKAVIEMEDGSPARLPINQLSEADIAYITENWGLPKECLIEQIAAAPRQWTPMTMTWKASNLCHTPLYFEDVNLERYGHTRGPLLEPFAQSAHFFGNILVLPYKMGVHSPRECQFALGYYRPGNCAPWIKPPVPISARGAIAQAATMTGLFWLIP